MTYNINEYFKKPSHPRYDFVYHVLGDFVDDTINYPLDLIALCKMNNWNLIPYSSFDTKPLSVSEDGFSIVRDGSIYIFYNYMQIRERINFTIAHEIGHIVLGRHLTNDVLSHNGIIDNDAMEKEANVFARNLLAPAPMLYDLKTLPSTDVGASSFGVSRTFMEIRYTYLYMDYKSIKFNDMVMEKFNKYTDNINDHLDEFLI